MTIKTSIDELYVKFFNVLKKPNYKLYTHKNKLNLRNLTNLNSL